ncbi:MAG: TorF family putative porin [Gemmobacter sp.]|nr:TorF family putative porin [Gemmobacter sp.]
MRHLLASSALALTVAVPSLSAAQDVSVSAGFTLTSRYIASGIEQTKGAAFQPYVEAEINGFYAGIWASNVSKALLGSSSEVDLYAGYRNEVGKFSYDIGYARYLYRGPSVNCCGEIILSLGYAVTDTFNVGATVKHDPSASITNTSISMDFSPVDKITLAAAAGEISKGGHSYWSVGGSYALTDNTSLDLTWHDTNITKGLVVASVSMDFSLR